MKEVNAVLEEGTQADTDSLLSSITLDDALNGEQSSTVPEEVIKTPEVEGADPVVEESTEDKPLESEKKEVEAPAKVVEAPEVIEEFKEEPVVVEEKEADKSEVLQKNYDELRKFSDRTISLVRKENKRLKEEMKDLGAKADITSNEDYRGMVTENQKLLEHNKLFANTLENMEKELGIKADDYMPNQVAKPLAAKDIEAIIAKQFEAQKKANEVIQPVEEEKDNFVQKTVLDFMGKKGLLTTEGSVGESGRAFIQKLKTLDPPEDVNSDLFEKMIDAHHSLNTKEIPRAVDNEVKKGLASAMSTLTSSKTNTSVKKQSKDALDSLMDMRDFLN